MLEESVPLQMQTVQPNFQIQDYEAFPALQGVNMEQTYGLQVPNGQLTPLEQLYGTTGAVAPPPGFSGLNPLASFTPSSSSHPPSRPGSRHGSRAPTPSLPAVDDNEAFPALGSAAAVKASKKHHGKRGHGHHPKEAPNTLADLVRMSPSPSPAQTRKGFQPKGRNFPGNRENSVAAQAIPPPEHIPWLETGDASNKTYLKHRAEAFKHGGLRNKYLQSAAQAYNRHDSRAAKALSLRGQAENNLMREAHRKAADILYEERNKQRGPNTQELYIDLHGKSFFRSFRDLPRKFIIWLTSFQVCIRKKQSSICVQYYPNTKKIIHRVPSTLSQVRATIPKMVETRLAKPFVAF